MLDEKEAFSRMINTPGMSSAVMEMLMNFSKAVIASAKEPNPSQTQKTSVCVFTQKEISKMPPKFKKLFKYNNVIAHVRLTERKVYEVRCSIDGVPYLGCSKDLDTAKAKFILDLKKDKSDFIKRKNEKKQTSSKEIMFNDYFIRWLTTVKKPYIKETTFKSYMDQYKAGIQKFFEGKPIKSLDAFTLQEYINTFTNSEKFRTAKKVYNLVSPCLEYAVADGIIGRNPMAKIVIPKYETKSGCPISQEEERRLVNALREKPTIYAQALVFLTYTGLRVGELATVEVDDGWITAVTEKKRKGLNEKKRRIPISPVLKRLMPYIEIETFKSVQATTISRHVSDYFKGHHTHDLRHTFITRCQEVGIRREIVSIWAGHNTDNSITSKVYTHLDQNEKLQLEEIAKFDYDI